MATASISLRDVGRTFGATRALADIDLDLEPGVTGLLGPNGAGKTTLLRLLATALPPTQGQVRVLGRDPQVSAQRTDIRPPGYGCFAHAGLDQIHRLGNSGAETAISIHVYGVDAARVRTHVNRVVDIGPSTA